MSAAENGRNRSRESGSVPSQRVPIDRNDGEELDAVEK
jgi:hypothetical protein